MADLIKIAEEAFATGKSHPSFKAGDTVTVAYKIVEGNKERVQLYASKSAVTAITSASQSARCLAQLVLNVFSPSAVPTSTASW